MNDPMNADERLLGVLRSSLRMPGDGSEDLVEMVMTGYDLTVSSGVTAFVSEDTGVTGLAPVRSADAAEPRFITCEAAGLTFEFEIDGSAVIGAIDPPRAGRVCLQQPDAVADTQVTRSGSFEVSLRGTSPFRLVFEAEDGETIATEWVLP